MTAASDETDGTGQGRPHDKASVRLSINLSAETADAFRELAERKGLSITEAIRRAIAAWHFLEDEASKGNQIAVIERDDSVRKVVVLL